LPCFLLFGNLSALKGVLIMSSTAEIFGSMVFNDDVMRQRLPAKTYRQLQATIKNGQRLDPEVANVVASVMKRWAMEQGATHYTHWFQPLTGITSEKHDGFVSPQTDGTAIMEFSGKELIKRRARRLLLPLRRPARHLRGPRLHRVGPSSYAFVKDDVLCIPTAFCSYTGEALDKKTPLLRSMSALSIRPAASSSCSARTVNTSPPPSAPSRSISSSKRRITSSRKDLILTGRTLFGAPSAKGQELEEHYFGTHAPLRLRFHEGPGRRAVEAGHPGQDQAQRGRPLPA
jgi:glutamine synthetase